jgi:hypothetical protein
LLLLTHQLANLKKSEPASRSKNHSGAASAAKLNVR